MDLKRLRTFVTVADLGTVSAAAARLRITQPALSRQLRDLQDEFGVALFEQVGRTLRLTMEGGQILPGCRALLAQADTLAEDARALAAGDSGEIHVGASPQMVASVFPRFLRVFARAYPKVRVRVREGATLEHLDRLRRGDLHAAVILSESATAEFVQHRLPTFLVMLAHGTRRGAVSVADGDIQSLDDVPMLLPPPGFGTRRLFDAAARLERVVPAVLMESHTPEILLAMAREGHGVAVYSSATNPDRRGLRVMPALYRGRLLLAPLAVHWNPKYRLPRYAEAFSAMLSEQILRALPPDSVIPPDARAARPPASRRPAPPAPRPSARPAPRG